MTTGTKSRAQIFKWVAFLVALVLAFALYRVVLGRPSFDADKIAEAETKMWRAYYSGDQTRLGFHLVLLLRSQYGLSLPEAKNIGELLAKSSIAFLGTRENYETVVLPDLTQAYRLLKTARDASFDPEAVARAELAWWVARRTPGEDSAGQVGAKIAEQYALLYGGDHPSFLESGVLRAQAGKLRDAGGDQADWEKVEELLKESYRTLAKDL